MIGASLTGSAFFDVQVEGGRTMKLRLNDPNYLSHVDRFWNTLLPKIAPYLYHRGGPILMTQVSFLTIIIEEG